MKFMKPNPYLSLRSSFVAFFVFLTLAISNTAIGQIFHGAVILKTPRGPDGTATARVGDIITATITVMHADEFFDTLTITSIVDVVHHASGDVVSPNLLPMPVTLDAFINPSIVVTHQYPVLPGDDSFPDRLLKDDAIAGGIDNRDGPILPPGIPDEFLLTFPGQVMILGETNETNICVIEAVSDSLNPGGSKHAIWLPGIATDLIFTPFPGSWVENPDGTAELTGSVRSKADLGSGFNVTVNLAGRTTAPCNGGPKKDLDPSAYIENGGPIDSSTWYYYSSFTGTLTGFGEWAGALLELTATGPCWQVGVGANNKNIRFGASAWFNWVVTTQPSSGDDLPNGLGDFNLTLFNCDYCVSEAVSDRFNPDGSSHAVWLPGISTDLIFTAQYGYWVENADGTATLTGTVRDRDNPTNGFIVSVSLSGRTLVPGPGSPKKDLDEDAYSEEGGPINTDAWYYYTSFIGTLTGIGEWEGALLNIVNVGPAWQVGIGASGKNIKFGASAWFTWIVAAQPSSGLITFPDGLGDFNIHIFPCKGAGLGDFVWADLNSNGLQDAGEPGVPGVEVRLTECVSSSPTTLLTTSTDANGFYLFTNLVAASFKVKVVAPAGMGFTTRNAGSNDDIDSDVTTSGFSPCVTLAFVQTNLTVDAGLVAGAPAANLRIVSVEPLPGGDMRLKIQGTLLRNYLVEGSENMRDWSPIATVLNVNGTLQFRDAVLSRCFYRVKMLP